MRLTQDAVTPAGNQAGGGAEPPASVIAWMMTGVASDMIVGDRMPCRVWALPSVLMAASCPSTAEVTAAWSVVTCPAATRSWG